jgi:hypothetical protein
MNSEKIPIRMDFEGEEAKKFDLVKKWLGLSQNTEVIRSLIAEKYREVLTLEEAEKKGA